MKELENEPITKASLLLLGYTHHVCDYYCAPHPADGATYRLDYEPTVTWVTNDGKRIGKDHKWRAYVTNNESTTIRRFDTLGELNYFHKGMCGDWIFEPEYIDRTKSVIK